MIDVRGLALRAGTRTLIEAASFEIRSGEFVAVLGANGAGKTTLLRTLAGVRPYADGSILIEGTDLAALSHAQRAAKIAHLAGDDVFLDKLAVLDVVAMGRYAHHRWWDWRQDANDEQAVAQALHAVGMERFAERSFDTLSSGERQRVWIALALAQQARVLLLDEPTSHLDVHAAQEILRLLRDQRSAGKTIVCALHDLNEAAQVADRVMLLGEGKVLEFDTPERVFAGDAVERAYGVRMETLRTRDGALRLFPEHT